MIEDDPEINEYECMSCGVVFPDDFLEGGDVECPICKSNDVFYLDW